MDTVDLKQYSRFIRAHQRGVMYRYVCVGFKFEVAVAEEW